MTTGVVTESLHVRCLQEPSPDAVDGYEFITQQEGRLAPDENVAGPATGTALPLPGLAGGGRTKTCSRRWSDARFGRDAAVFDRLLECGVVAIVLVGVAGGEACEGVGELGAFAEVSGDRGGVA